MLSERYFHAEAGGLFDDDEVGNAADGDKIAGKRAGDRQGVPLGLVGGIEEFDHDHGGRDIADHIAQDTGDPGKYWKAAHAWVAAAQLSCNRIQQAVSGDGLDNDEQGAEQDDQVPVYQDKHVPGAHFTAAQQQAGYAHGWNLTRNLC